MKKLRKIFRQNVVTMPKKGLLSVEVALGVRAQYAAILAVSVLMASQIVGVAIFSGKALAALPSIDLQLDTRAATNVDVDYQNNASVKFNFQTNDLHNLKNADYSFEYGTTTSYGQEAEVTSTQVALDSQMALTGGPPGVYSYAQAKDGQGNIYKINDGNLYKYNAAGQYLLQVTAPAHHFQGSLRANIAFDSEDNLYVGGFSNVVEKYSPSGTLLNTLGSASYVRIATDPDDNLYVIDTRTVSGSIVHKYDPSGALIDEFTMPFGTAVLCGGDLAIDSVGNLYVSISDCDSQTPDSIQKLTSDGDLIDTWDTPVAGILNIDDSNIIYVRGQATYTTDGDPIPSPASLPVVSHLLGYKVLLDVDTDQGIAYMMDGQDESNAVLAYTRLGSVQVNDLQCGGTYHYRVKGVAGSDTAYGDDQEVTISCNPLNIQTGWLPNGSLGEFYEQPIQTNASGGTTTYSVSQGQLPPGLSLNSETGMISGIATEAGSFTFTLHAENDGPNTPGPADQELTIEVYGQNLGVTESTQNLIVGESYNYQVQTTGGLGGQVQFERDPSSDDFPPGISMDSSGAITGTPTEPGSYQVLIRVTQGPLTATGYVQFEVENPAFEPIGFQGTGLGSALVGRSFSEGLEYFTNNGFGPRTYALTAGALPTGITLNPLTGVISGVPTVTGTYNFTVEVTDISGTASAQFSLTILPRAMQLANKPIVSITSPTENTQFDAGHDSVVVTGTGPANQPIKVSMDGYELATVTVGSGGTWSYIANNIFPGNHSFEAKYVPVGDLAVLGSFVDSEYAPENGKVSIVDMGTGQRIQSISLPPYSIVFATSINAARTKAYVVGAQLDLDSVGSQSIPFMYEIDLGTGMLGRILDMSSTGSDHTVSALTLVNDHTAYIEYGFTYLESSIAAVNLDTMTLGASVGMPLSNDYNQGNHPRNRNISQVEANGRLYSSLSTQDDDDLGTATVINTADNSMQSVTLLDEPLWSNCATEVVKASNNDVYYVSNDKLVKMNTANGTVASSVTMDSILQSSHLCVRSIQIDTVHNKAYVIASGVLFAVDLSSGATTKIQDISGSLVINALVETYIDWTRQMQPDQEITPELRQMLLDTITNQTPSSFPYQQSNLMSLNSASSMLHVIWANGIISNFNTGTSQYTEAMQSYFGYAGYTAQTGAQRLIAPVGVAPSASVSFTIQEGEIIDPGCLEDCEPVDPDCIEDCDPVDPGIVDPEVTVTPSSPTTTKTTPIKSSPILVNTQNSFLALVARIPEPVAVGLPWLLLVLALILVSSQYYQVHTESAGTRRMQNRVDHQRRLVEEQNNFVALSTHYLHTPLTVMEGEISLMVKAGTLTQEQATKLRATLTSLSAEAEAVLAREEQNKVE